MVQLGRLGQLPQARRPGNLEALSRKEVKLMLVNPDVAFSASESCFGSQNELQRCSRQASR